MSIDRSLKIKGALTRHRNVLSRPERIDALKEDERWQEGAGVLGLPKVAHRKSHAGKKTAEEKATAEAAAAPGTETPQPGEAAEKSTD
ncbi:MAG: small basic protein [Sedimentisphaerales bacterium]|nr:small basic protein [Sedimentisphaerales bacterium]